MRSSVSRAARTLRSDSRRVAGSIGLGTDLLLLVFLALPVDVRARAQAVCRVWRDLVRTQAWSVVNLTKVTEAAVRSVCTQATGKLSRLFLRQEHKGLLLELCTAHADTLQRVFINAEFTEAEILAVLEAAPRLEELHVCFKTRSSDAARVVALPQLRFFSLCMHGELPANALLGLSTRNKVLNLYIATTPLLDYTKFRLLLHDCLTSGVQRFTMSGCTLNAATFNLFLNYMSVGLTHLRLVALRWEGPPPALYLRALCGGLAMSCLTVLHISHDGLWNTTGHSGWVLRVLAVMPRLKQLSVELAPAEVDLKSLKLLVSTGRMETLVLKGCSDAASQLAVAAADKGGSLTRLCFIDKEGINKTLRGGVCQLLFGCY
jgi:hypothetical protein